MCVSSVGGSDVIGPFTANFKVNATVNTRVNAIVMRAASHTNRIGLRVLCRCGWVSPEGCYCLLGLSATLISLVRDHPLHGHSGTGRTIYGP